MKFMQEQGGWPNKSHAGHFLITLSAKDTGDIYVNYTVSM